MAAPTANALASRQLADLHARFLALLPRIETHGRIYFRHVRCSQLKADAIQEMRSLAWRWFVRLKQRGKDPGEFMHSFVNFVARAVNNGRRLTGTSKAKDAMNPGTQRRRGFRVEPLQPREQALSAVYDQHQQDAFEERLQDNTRTPVPDQAAFRIDWPAWMKTRTHRDRRIIDDLMAGHGTFAVSQKHQISSARVSQLRREFHEDWSRFCADSEPAKHAAA